MSLFILVGSYVLARFIYRPILLLESRMSKMAAKGMLQLPGRESEGFEIRDLARSIDSISNQLNTRMETVLQQKNEQEAVFSSMGEGVVALDVNKNILHMNRAASQILSVPRLSAQNQKFVQVIRVPEILDLIEDSMTQ
ncbi:MAG: PAS domain-containing protein, partial [Bdellovibrionota bacterium]